MKIYDITIPIQRGMAVWPGDTPYRFEEMMKIRDGASVNLGTVTMSVHTGTHADAPYHFRDAGATIDAVPLDCYIGPAILVDVSGKATIQYADLENIDFTETPRLLLRTNAWTDTFRFPQAIPVLAPDVPAFLGRQGVRLLGLDTPSVDLLESKTLPLHHALAANNIAILESLNLTDVPEGRYELIALPIPLKGADGAPVRAILRG